MDYKKGWECLKEQINYAILIHKCKGENEGNKIECKTQEEVVNKVFEELARNASIEVLKCVINVMEKMEKEE